MDSLYYLYPYLADASNGQTMFQTSAAIIVFADAKRRVPVHRDGGLRIGESPHRRPARHRAPEAAQQRPTRTGASPPSRRIPPTPTPQNLHATNYTTLPANKKPPPKIGRGPPPIPQQPTTAGAIPLSSLDGMEHKPIDQKNSLINQLCNVDLLRGLALNFHLLLSI